MRRQLGIIGLLQCLFIGPALAGSATVGVNPGSIVNFGVTTDIGGNYQSKITICDFSACANGLSINSNGHALIELYQGVNPVGATNGLYSNLLQGNAVLSAANGAFVQPTTAALWSVVGTASNAGSALSSTGANIAAVSWLYAFNGTTWDQVQVDTNKYLKVNCLVGCTSGTLSNAASGVATSASNLGTVSFNYGFNGTTWDQLQVDASKFLKVNCATGCTAGTASNATSAVATSATNLGAVSWNYGFNGTTWDQLQVDASKFLKVNCASGCTSGSLSNATSGVATSATNLGTVAYNYGFNGTTWDQLQVDASKFLKVNCSAGCTVGSVSNAAALAPSSTNSGSIAYLYGYNGTNWAQGLVDASGFIEVNTAAGGIQGFSPGQVWSGANGVGLAAGEQHVGEVGSHGGVLTSSALGVTATSHAAGACFGVLVTFSNAARNNAAALSSGTSGIIQNIVVGFASASTPTNLDAVFFIANPGTNPCGSDGATFSIAAADIGKALPPVHLSDLTASNVGYLMTITNMALRYGLTSSTTLYAALVVRSGSFTPATGATFNIGVFED